ncbi:P-loop containing nucleoside triphosphate hydrolase protein [Haematococcus lacustris]
MAEVFKYEYCTHVQSQALPACLAGGDVLAKAKTGTGKTIAFGIPVIETLLARPQPRGQVGALILSPTRELAYQIHAEFVKLLTFHKLSLQVMIGGTNLNSEAGRLKKCVPDILVATPGRCLDHMTNEASQLQRYMSGCRVLVCDEADNLLDMGFKPTIERILNFLPPRGQRQALLFSATFPQDVQSLARFALNAPYTTVDTVGEETSTNVQVEQQEAVVPFEEQFAYLYASLLRHTKEDPKDYKVIVFFPTARQTQIYAEAFEAAGMPVLEIHSRKSQAQRTRVSDEFRRNSRVMMFSSDVSARGVDYPDVSLVVQVGAPSDKAQYVHRVGRTARAGKAGKALLMLCDFEADFRRQLKELPLVPAPALSPAEHRAATNAMATGLSRVSSETKSKAYQAWLGFYKSCPWVKMSPAQVVAQANNFATVMGCLEPPELQASTVGKMGLKGVPGLRIAGRGGVSGGGGGGGRGGGGGARGGSGVQEAYASNGGGGAGSSYGAGYSGNGGGYGGNGGGYGGNGGGYGGNGGGYGGGAGAGGGAYGGAAQAGEGYGGGGRGGAKRPQGGQGMGQGQGQRFRADGNGYSR